MDTPLILELNIALIPSNQLSHQLVAVSQKLAHTYPTLVQLGLPDGRLAMAPHLTLYQVPLLLDNVTQAVQQIREEASEYTPFNLMATEYAYNQEEASLEIGYETTDELVALQTAIITTINPLRGELLLERDPAGNDLHAFLTTNSRQGEDVRRTGYWEVGDSRQGGFFRPHATLNWFTLGTQVDLQQAVFPDPITLNGIYTAIGIYSLGPKGSCPQLIASCPLTESQNL